VISLNHVKVPKEATEAFRVAEELLGRAIVGVYLFGSAVAGGLHADSDVVPWQFPPRNEYLYGEWLRDQFEHGQIPEPAYDPDLAIVLAQIRKNSIPLYGPDASSLLEPVPMAHIRKAIMACLPGLIESIRGDERNVILTLARMWLTAAVGEISPKDAAAEWAIPQLPEEHAALLDLAAQAYRGEYADKWEGLDSEVAALVHHMRNAIEACLGGSSATSCRN